MLKEIANAAFHQGMQSHLRDQIERAADALDVGRQRLRLGFGYERDRAEEEGEGWAWEAELLSPERDQVLTTGHGPSPYDAVEALIDEDDDDDDDDTRH